MRTNIRSRLLPLLFVPVALLLSPAIAFSADVDNDQMLDSWEVANFSDLSHDGTADTDNDGILDLDEFIWDRDPNVDDGGWDLDGDGFPDVYEIIGGSDPDDSGDVPTPTYVVDWNETGDYTGINAAIAAADAQNGEYQIIAILPGTYSGYENCSAYIDSSKPHLLIVGTGGAASTILDCQHAIPGWTLNGGVVLASLTIRHTLGAAISIYSSEEVRLVDLFIHDNTNLAGAGGVTASSVSALYISGSTLLNNTGDAYYADQIYVGVGDAFLSNAVVWNALGGTALNISPYATLSAHHSFVFGETLSGTGNLASSTDPLLRSDGRLLPGSPLIEAGDIGNQSRLDMDMELRPTSDPDMGVDQGIDSDSDGLADSYELAFAAHLGVLTGLSQDQDEDGLTNEEELVVESSPTNPDTDGDGLSDGDEVDIHGTNPLSEDSDGDAMPDAWELSFDLDPLEPNAYSDQDGDRYLDVFEYAGGTDPTDDEDLPTPTSVVNAAGGADFTEIGPAVAAAAIENGSFQVIRVEAGLYTGSANCNVYIGSNQPHILLIGAAGAASTVIDCEGAASNWSLSQGVALASLTLRRLGGTGIAIYTTSEVRFIDMVVRDNTTYYGGGLYASTISELQIVGSTFLNNTALYGGDQLYLGSGHTHLTNTVVWNQAGGSAVYLGYGTTLTADNSLVFGETLTGDDNLAGSTDPGVRFDGRLSSASPLIEAGATVPQSLLDMDGEARPGSEPDIGADQFVDLDSDLLADSWELEFAANTGVLTGPSQDEDEDGLTNLEEFELGTAPTNPDTDGDGLSDGDEVDVHGTNPLSDDSDGDAMPDAWELSFDLDPLATDSYDDLDGDRILNVFEYAGETDPSDAEDAPEPTYVVNVAGGADYTDIGSAVNATDEGNGSFQVIEVQPGVYSGTENCNLYVTSAKPHLLILGAAGAAATVVDCQYAQSSWSLGRGIALASLTLRRFAGTGLSPSTSEEIRLVDMIVRDNHVSYGGGISGATIGELRIVGSTFLNNTGDYYSDQLYLGGGHTHLVNSVVWNTNGGTAVYLGGEATLTAENSLVFGETLTGSDNLAGSTVPLIRFDGRLFAASPLIEAGASTSQSLWDMDLEERPGSTPDIGADQFVDVDQDSLADSWELAYAESLGILTGASEDHDEDALTNVTEFELGTDPASTDSDGDGLSDGFEQSGGTDPLVADTDHDGMPDGYELANDLDPLVDDAFVDNDGDRFGNVYEYARGTDPNAIESIPTPDFIVDLENGGSSETDNIFDDLQEAVAAAVTSTAAYPIVGLVSGTYTGYQNRGFTLSAGQPRLLVIGLEGAGTTIIDGELEYGQFSIQARSVLASLTIRNFGSTSPVSIYGAPASGSRLVDLVITGSDYYVLYGAVQVTDARDIEINGCTIFDNTGVDGSSRGLYVASNSQVKLRSSVLWNSELGGELYWDTTGTVTADYSLVRANEITGLNDVVPATDPLLDADGRPDPGSPLIAHGAIADSRFDMDLEYRSNVNPDIGADQVGLSPYFSSSAPDEAFVGELYSYLPLLMHPNEEETLTLSIVDGPVGMTVVDGDTIEWTPLSADVGPHVVVLRVTDSQEAFNDQLYVLDVFDSDDDNDPPFFVSTPVLAATLGVAYAYQAEAVDPDFGDFVLFSAVAGPSGMSVSQSGVVSWTPSSEQWGAHSVVLRATDEAGLSVDQAYTIQVVGHAPSISSTPPETGTFGFLYAYEVEASDEDESDVLSYSLLTAPPSMTIDPTTGVLEWDVDADGTIFVDVLVQDSTGLSDHQEFEIEVDANNDPNFVSTGPAHAVVDEELLYQAEATDVDGDAVSYSLVDGPAGMTVTAMGELSWTPTSEDPGTHDVTIAASDGRGGTDEQTFSITVTTFHPPSVAIGLGTPRNLARLEDGASIASVSSSVSGHPASALLTDSANDNWEDDDSPSSPWTSYVTVDLVGGVSTINRVVFEQAGCGQGTGPGVEVYTSTTGAPGSFRPVGGGWPQSHKLEVRFSPVQAGYVQLWFESGGGGRLEVWTPEPDGSGVRSLYEAGASIADATGDDEFARSAIDAIPESIWTSVAEGPKQITVALSDGEHIVDRASISVGPNIAHSPYTSTLQSVANTLPSEDRAAFLADWWVAGPRNIEIAVSKTTDEPGEFETVYSGEVPRAYGGNAPAFWFKFQPTMARFVRLTVIDNQDGPEDAVILDQFRVYGPEEGGENVVFSARAIAGDGAITSVEWDFGDGRHSAEMEPFVRLAPGVHTIWLSVEDDNGMTATASVAYESFAAPAADYSGDPGDKSAYPNAWLTDTSTLSGYAVMRRWSGGECEVPPNPYYPGWYYDFDYTLRSCAIYHNDMHSWTFPLWLEVTDQRLLTGRTIRPYFFEDHECGYPYPDPFHFIPLFATSPQWFILAGLEYQYEAHAVDGDDETLTYTLEDGPDGMAIDSSTGVLTWATSIEDVGIHDVVIYATDEAFHWGYQFFRINVVGAAGTPQFVSEPPLEAIEGVPYSYFIETVDPDQGDVLSLALTTAPEGATISDVGVLEWLPGQEDNGENEFVIEVTDLLGHTATQPFTVTVEPVNSAPVLDTDPPVAAFVGEEYEEQLDTSDDVPGAITHALVAGPSGLTVSSGGLVTWTPSSGDLGPHLVSVSITDSEEATNTVEFLIQVFDTDESNDAPQITSTAVTSATERAPYVYEAQGFDPDPEDPILWSVTSGPTGLAIGATTGVVTYTPTPAQVGNQNVIIRVSDLIGLYDEQSFTIVVAADPDPPAFVSAPVINAVVGAPYTYTPTAIDPNGDSVSYALDTGPTGMTLDGAHVLHWTPTLGQVGTHNVEIVASDPGEHDSSQNFTITVRNLSQAPSFTTPPAQATVYVGERFVHHATASDPNPNDMVTIEVATGPSGLSYSEEISSVNWVPASNQVGERSFVLRASDLALNAVLQSSSLEVRGFEPPYFTSIPPTHARPEEAYSYTISAADPDLGDTVELSLVSGPSGLTMEAGTMLAWTPSLGDIGSHAVLLEARDLRGARTTQAFNVVVAENEIPQITSSPSGTTIEAGDTFSYQLVVSDDGPAPLSTTLVEGPPGMTLSGSLLLTWDSHLDDVGSYEVVVRAADGLGFWTEQFFDLMVRPPEPSGTSDPEDQVPDNTYCEGVSDWMSAWSNQELDVLGLINQVRAQGADCGGEGWFGSTGPLFLEPTLRCAARGHSLDMFTRSFFANVNPDDQNATDRAELAGYGGGHVNENLGLGAASASAIVNAMLASDTHCANIMDPMSAAIGVGYYPGGGAYSELYTIDIGIEATGNRPPVFTAGSPRAILVNDRLLFVAAARDPEGEAISYELVNGPTGLTVDATSGLVLWRPSTGDLGAHTYTVQATDASDGIARRTFSITVLPRTLPPNPTTVASALPVTEIPSFFDQVAFLWRASSRVQHGVDESIMVKDQVAVVRGSVRLRGGSPQSGVRVRVADHPELGFTLTRGDGRFDLAVLGGGPVVLEYGLAGFIPVERTVEVPWADYAEAPAVALVAYDTEETTVSFGSGSMQVARGSEVTDGDGTRRATVLLPAGVDADAVLADGSHQALSAGTMRATELTVGSDGLAAMPAELPLGTGYTYAVELSIDEAEALGASGVEFSDPVPLYVDNFLEFPVGGQVPSGYYDRALGNWVPEEDGRIIEILSTSGDIATLDVDGTSEAATTEQLAELGITTAERQHLAALYSVGDQLWRTPVLHFSTHDENWPIFWCDGGDCPPPRFSVQTNKNVERDCVYCGSVIEAQDQTLGEQLGIPGTGLSLHYMSDRVPGRTDAYTLTVPITGSDVPADAINVRVEIEIAGRHEEVSLLPVPNQTYSYVWDGKDAYGRTVLGKRTVRARVAFDYETDFQQPSPLAITFGLVGAENGGAQVELRPGRRDLSIWAGSQTAELGTLDARAVGLGGWTLSAHHMLDPGSDQLFLGDGSQRALTSKPGHNPTDPVLVYPRHVEVDKNGDVYVADPFAHRVWKIDGHNGTATVFAGTGAAGFSGDDGPATQAQLDAPWAVAADRKGNVFIADYNNHRIRRVQPNGWIDTIAGTGEAGFDGDNGIASLAKFNHPVAIAVGPDDAIYVADVVNARIRKIVPSGIAGFGSVHTVVGSSSADQPLEDGSYALRVSLESEVGSWGTNDIAVASNGDLYFVLYQSEAGFVFRVRNGKIERVAGCTEADPNDCDGELEGLEGGDANKLLLEHPGGLALDGGDVIVTNKPENRHSMVYRITPSKKVYLVAGASLPSWSGYGPRTEPLEFDSDCGPSLDDWDDGAQDVAIGPDKRVYITDGCQWGPGGHLSVVGSAGRVTTNHVDVVSADGASIFRFSQNGQHQETIDTLTGETLLTFGYTNGYLTTITDAFSNVTTIERSGNGSPERIVAPFGQETEFVSLSGSGYVTEIDDEEGARYRYGYGAGGLLTSYTDPANNTAAKQYDLTGRLIRDDDMGGGYQTLTRTKTSAGYEVAHSTTLDRTTVHEIDQRKDGTSVRAVVAPDGARSTSETKADGTGVQVAANGVVTTTKQGPDPRFGMDAPIVVEAATEMPSSLRMEITRKKSVTLSDPADPLSLESLQTVVTVNGRTSTTTYVASTHTVSTITAGGRTTETDLDALGRPIEVRVSGMLPIEYSYDAQGRLYQTVQGDRTRITRFRSDGWADEVEDAINRIASFSYDAVGRTTASVGPDGRVTTFTFDVNGNLQSLTPPGREAHEYSYNSRNLETQYEPPLLDSLSTPTEHQYDADKAPTRTIFADARQIEPVYLPNGKLDRLTTPDGDIEYTYHELTGELESITPPSGLITTYTRDGDLVTDIAYSGLFSATVHREYDDDFRVVEESVNGGNAIAFEYDPDGLLLAAGSMSITSDPDNGMLASTSLGVVSDSLDFTGYGELETYEAQISSSPYYTRYDERDDLGRIFRSTETIASTTQVFEYEYDLAGRLEQVTRDSVVEATYAYDANDNRISVTDLSGTRTATVDAQDRLLAFGDFEYTYNEAGQLETKTNIVTDELTTYTYDVLGNLLTVDVLGGDRIDYAVDGAGHRVGRWVNTVLDQTYIWSGGRIVASIDGGSVLTRYVYAAGGVAPDYLMRNGTTYRYAKDSRGSVRLVINVSTGAIAQRIDYGPFGENIGDNSPGFQPFGYAGGIADSATGLVRFGVRDYDSSAGRWTDKDPLGFRDTFNRYAYVGNEPINRVDPSGTQGLLNWIGAVNAIVPSAIGLALNIPSLLFGDAKLGGFHHNALNIENSPVADFLGNALTLGNVTMWQTGPHDSKFAGQFGLPRRGWTAEHEEQHTYQAEILGPTYMHAWAIGAGLSEVQCLIYGKPADVDRTHNTWNLLENGPMQGNGNPPYVGGNPQVLPVF